ncbi:unnamed protein product, partial [Rotaria socialis]
MSEKTSIPNSNQPPPHHTPATTATGAQSPTLVALAATQLLSPSTSAATEPV